MAYQFLPFAEIQGQPAHPKSASYAVGTLGGRRHSEEMRMKRVMILMELMGLLNNLWCMPGKGCKGCPNRGKALLSL